MKIEVELFGQLLPSADRRQTLTLDTPLTVGEVAARLGINPEEIGLISINGVQSEMEDTVPPGCRLCFFPPLSGG
jgi:molybdopterin converting factor small subunit